MSSHQEPDDQEAGPSGLSLEDTLALLGLKRSDSEPEEPLSHHDVVEERDIEQEDPLACHEVLGDSDDDELCNNAMDRFERQRAFQTRLLQQSGGGLDPQTPVGTFDFDLEPFVDRQSSRMGVRERHFNTRLRQTGNFVDSPHVVQALQEGLRRAVDRVLTTTPNLHDQDHLYFTLSSNRLTSNFQGWGLRAGEWRKGGARLDALFQRLAQALNSNEQFEMDDSFQLSITQVHHTPWGSGRKRHTKPGHQTLQTLTAQKKSVIRTQNKDDLCCARALVTAKAKVDQHPKWRSIQQGTKLQKELALLLHHEADVPLGPCRYEELTTFSTAPSLYDYEILLVDADRSFHITTFGPTQPKQLILLHEKDHYDVITSLRRFGGPVTCVPTVGNPMTIQDVIDVQTTKSNAAPVAKKTAPISFMLTHGVSKPPDVARTVIVTFSGTLASKCISPKTTPENPRPALSTPFAFVDVDVPLVSNWKWGSKVLYAINAGTWIVLLATSTSTPNPPLFHSESSHPSRNPRAEKEAQTSTSRRSSRQTGCCRGSSNPASQ